MWEGFRSKSANKRNDLRSPYRTQTRRWTIDASTMDRSKTGKTSRIAATEDESINEDRQSFREGHLMVQIKRIQQHV